MDAFVFIMLMMGFILLIKIIGHNNEELSNIIQSCAKAKDEKMLDLEKRLSYLEGIIKGIGEKKE